MVAMLKRLELSDDYGLSGNGSGNGEDSSGEELDLPDEMLERIVAGMSPAALHCTAPTTTHSTTATPSLHLHLPIAPLSLLVYPYPLVL